MDDSMMMMNGSGNASNQTFPCGIPPFFPPSLNIPEAINYIQACIALLLGTTGFVLNLFILIMIAAYKSLHRRLMYLALHIVLIDLIYTISIPPVIFMSGISGEWLLGVVMCNILGMVHDFFALFRFTMTLILTLDRFISVFWPFFYCRNSLRIIASLLPIVYTASILRAVIPLPGLFGCFLYVPTQKTCTAYSGCSDECFWFVVVSSLVIVTFGMIIPLCLYIVLFCKTRTVKRRSMSVIGSVAASSVATTSIGMSIELLSTSGKYDRKHKDRREVISNGNGAFRTQTAVHMCNGTSTPSTVNPVFSFETGLDSDVPMQNDSRVIKRVDARSSIDSNATDDNSVARDFRRVLASHEESPSDAHSLDHQSSPSSEPDEPDPQVTSVGAEEVPVESEPRTGISTHSREGIEVKQIPLNLLSVIRSVSPASGQSELKTQQFSPSAYSRRPSAMSDEFTLGKRSHIPRHSVVTILPAITKSSGKKFGSSSVRANITMFILLMSVIGCTAPAWSLYGIQFLYLEPQPILFIVNMMVGRTFFNLLPVIDAIAIMRHQEFRIATKRFFRSLRRKLYCSS